MPEWDDTEKQPLVVWYNTAHPDEMAARGEKWQAWAARVGGYPGYAYGVRCSGL